MYMNMTTVKVALENREKFIKAMTEFPEQVGDAFKACNRYYLLETADEPGLFISITIFESPEKMAESFDTPEYAELIKSKLMPLMIAKPTRAGFTVIRERAVINDVCTWIHKA